MINKRLLSLLDIKQAIFDERFQILFPELKEEIKKVLFDPGCSCNKQIYYKFFQYPERLEKFFPNRTIEKAQEEETLWQVINCSIHELESKLRNLPKGRKQIAVARYQEQVTVIVNFLGE